MGYGLRYLTNLVCIQLTSPSPRFRYKYGIFAQRITDGYQVEFPDPWLKNGNPWEVERSDINYPVRFHGELIEADSKVQAHPSPFLVLLYPNRQHE